MEGKGIIAFFAGHRVAANLLMILMILYGLWGMTRSAARCCPTST